MSTPLWVQWDRVPRNPTFSKEAFYVAREDGLIIYSEIVDSSKAVETSEAGVWPFPIDKAFTALVMDTSSRALSYPDVLMATGVASDGLSCRVGAFPTQYQYQKSFFAQHLFTPVEAISNWAPVSDLAITRLGGRERDALLIANGRAPHGTISELRRGLNAIIDNSFGGVRGCTGLWVINYATNTYKVDGKSTKQHYAILLVTLPPESLVIHVMRTQNESGSAEGESWSNWEEGEWDYAQIPSENAPVQDDIVRDEDTISACMLGDDYTIQITRREARLLQRSSMLRLDSTSFPSSLLAAATSSKCPWISVVFRQEGKIVLYVALIQEGLFDKSIRHELEVDPTCLELLDINGTPHVFVGKSDSSFVLFRIHESGSFVTVYSDVLDRGPDTGLRMVCESAVLLELEQSLVVVCGTRNGFLLNMALDVTNERMDISLLIKRNTKVVQNIAFFQWASRKWALPQPK